MNGFLRQSTASQARAIGPFLDDSDFKSSKTALTIANTDIKLMANGAASANKNSGGGTHRANGVYGVTFDATDTATVGELFVSVVVATALPVWHTFVVLEEAVYDALYITSAPGYVTDQPVNVTKVGGTTQTAGDLMADTNDIQTRLPAALVGGRMDVSVGAYQSGLTPLQPTTAGRTLDVSTTGEAGVDWANVGGQTTTVGLTNTTISSAQVVGSVSGAVGSVSGAIASVTSVGSIAANGITAASIATGAIDADALAADASVEIAAAVLAAALTDPIAANVEKINTIAVVGNGSSVPWGA